MSKQIQLRRGTTAEHTTFAGAVGEVTVDTTKDTLVVHDGSLNGGYPLARASDITTFISLDDLSATTGITYNSGVIGADTDVLATKTFVTTTVTNAVAGKDNTDEITEGVNNLYFTTARARDTISVTDSGGDGSLSYANGVITYIGPSASDVRAHFTASTGISITNGAISVDSTVATKTYVTDNIATALATKDNTDEITEGSTNLYYTDSRARNAISLTDASGDGSLTYNTLTGALVYTGPSASEVRAHFTAGTGVTITDGQVAADTAVMATRSYVDTAVSGKDNTDEITEGTTNLYYTNTRARGAVSVTDNGGDGSLAYDSGTGVFSYTGPSASEVRAHFTAGSGITIATGQVSVDTSTIATKSYVDTAVAGKDNTDEITEGTTNLYFTDARARSALTFTAGSGDYNSTTGAITIPTNTSQLANGAGFIIASDNITGSAAKWTTPRTITLGGDLTGSVSIDGSANATLTATVAANSVALGTDTTGNYVATIANGSYITGGSGVGSEGAALTLGVNATKNNTGNTVVARDGDGDFSAGIITAALSGNATTATTLQTARTISLTGDVTGSVSFNGSANAAITTTIAANSVALGTDTTGNYVAGLTAGTGVTVSGTAGEGWSPTVAIGQPVGTTDDVTFNSITVNGNLTVSGTTTTVSTTDLSITDPLIYIGTGNTGNAADLGIVGHFNDGLYQHSGIVRKASADKWYLFSGMTTEPSTTITTTDATFAIDTLVANIEGSLTGNASTASAWQTARTISLGGDLSGSVSLNGSADVTLTATIAANSVALGTDTTGNYVEGITAGTGVTVSGSGSEGASPTVSIGQAVATSDSPTFVKIFTSNNGLQENIKIGDDAWIGDTNVSNTVCIKGVQNAEAAYIVFGTADQTQLGRTGTGALTYGGNTIWHAGNDGASSGLDADLLDGQHGSYYATASGLSSLTTTVDGKAAKSALYSTTNGGSIGLNVASYDTFVITMNANTTFSTTGTPVNPGTFTLVTKQDATGGRTITWPASFKFNGGIAPPQTTTPGAVDVWSLFTYDSGSTYIVSLAVKDAK